MHACIQYAIPEEIRSWTCKHTCIHTCIHTYIHACMHTYSMPYPRRYGAEIGVYQNVFMRLMLIFLYTQSGNPQKKKYRGMYVLCVCSCLFSCTHVAEILRKRNAEVCMLSVLMRMFSLYPESENFAKHMRQMSIYVGLCLNFQTWKSEIVCGGGRGGEGKHRCVCMHVYCL
jgi:hypothetical protein